MESARGLRSPEAVAERVNLLETAPEVQPLREWADGLAERRDVVVPYFDPAEAGVETRVLFLLEAPGPMTNADNARPGSGFISVDNDDLTAENCWVTRNEYGLDKGALHWNIVPWYLGPASVHPNAAQTAQGAMEFRRLLPLLPDLRAVVLCGRIPQSGWKKHIAPFLSNGPTVIETWHPSPLSMNQPGHRDDFRRAVERAARYAT